MCDCVSGVWDDFMETGRQIVGCICCCAIVGPILVLIGIIVLVSALKDTRGDKIKKYNAAVDKWNSQSRDELLAAQFTNTNSGASGGAEVLGATTAVDVLRDDDKDLKSYEPLKYRTAGGFSFASATLGTSDIVYTADISASQNGGPASTMSVGLTFGHYISRGQGSLSRSCQLTATSTSTGSSRPLCSQVCSDDGGQWDSTTSTCRFYLRASDMCLKVTLSGSSWTPASVPGSGFGCLYKNQGGTKGDWSISSYTSVSAGATITPSTVQLTIRSSDDPYILASDLTNGSYDFGLTRAQKIVIGIVLIVIGCVWMCCVCGGVYAIYMCFMGNNRSGRFNNHKGGAYGNNNNNNNGGGAYNGGGGGYNHGPAPAQPVVAHPAPPPPSNYNAPPPSNYNAPPPSNYNAPPPGNPYGGSAAPPYSAAVGAPPPAYGGAPPSYAGAPPPNPYAPPPGGNPYQQKNPYS
ncbi:uncharacterized protein AMSG_06066 [Thecamonas trahens ATCC 50062]|uniref:Uncharacterized protein n=1 Tax=Thecamonas trahens ATCC 50062 TaxID=461836 RepID=A0A0L0DBR9_THETB|nr:hypothetical protein AMSG_06066 [Thecamonas trahens ATCC 50062]KNC49787.1 hypothetical protein AMSG_06066 [Thecamonas trahens ATCC 50062]|eukprot:XP_013757571.1 hypothetical protein AMSG_06066 [Thecamonas trahens ATCC 50062]